jgi:hypothetical protein
LPKADRQEVPRALRVLLYALLIVAGAVSLPFIGAYGPLPTTTLLDAWLVLFAALCFFRGRTQTGVLLLVLTGYALTRLVPALASDSPMYDFLQAYRWVIYLFVFAFAVGRRWGSMKPLVGVTWALLGMALAKSAATFALLGPGERPGLLLENNFELALFCGLVVVLYRHLGRGRFWAVGLLSVLTAFSASRSGAVAFALLAIFAVTQAKRANLFVKYLLACAIPVVGVAVIWVFESRVRVGQSIDRLNFLEVFSFETSEWTPLEWFVGTMPITPLSDAACQRLNYFQLLFASTEDGTCYSVILHAFTLRVIFDAGILGLLLALGVTLYTMRKSGVQLAVATTLLLIAFTNGLSVSGLNNPYVALPILLAIVGASAARDDPSSGLPLTGGQRGTHLVDRGRHATA